MILKTFKSIALIIFISVVFIIAIGQTGCGIYKFNDASVPDSIHIVKINFINNKASYVNPTLAPELTEKLRQKIIGQTRLKQTNGDNFDWEITPTITNYSFSTAGISNQQVSTNRLNVGVHVEVNDVKAQKVSKYDVSRSFDYPGTQTLQQAEQGLKTEMLRSLADDIFNRIFSNW